MAETVVLAIGGNALAPAGLGDFAGQEERARHVADAAVALLDSSRRLLMPPTAAAAQGRRPSRSRPQRQRRRPPPRPAARGSRDGVGGCGERLRGRPGELCGRGPGRRGLHTPLLTDDVPVA